MGKHVQKQSIDHTRDLQGLSKIFGTFNTSDILNKKAYHSNNPMYLSVRLASLTSSQKL